MSKTPYEIRSDLLTLTFNILNSNVERSNMAKQINWQAEMDANKSEIKFPQLDYISIEEVIEEATKLNRFVSDGK